MIVTHIRTGNKVKIQSNKGKPMVTKKGMVKAVNGRFEGGLTAIKVEEFNKVYKWIT